MIGRKLSRYQILEKLGEGGMGVVYKARDERLRRSVAIKALPAAVSEDPDRLRRLLREARAASALDHPGLVTVHDVFEHEGTELIVMELVVGRTLKEIVPPEGLPWTEAVRLALPIAEATAAAHDAGVVHRDLKPSNVMVLPVDADQPARIKVLDFGLAVPDRSMPDEDAVLTVSTQAAAAGTPAYMSPEQSLGEPLDARTDVFSFGVMLYEMLSGRRPFRGAHTGELFHALHYESPQPLRELRADVPEKLVRLVERLLVKKPGARTTSLHDAARTLRAAAESAKKTVADAPTLSAADPPIEATTIPDHLSAWIDENPAPVVRTLLRIGSVGADRLVADLGERAAAEIFERRDRLVRDLAIEFEGLALDRDDGFLLLFERPIAAASFAATTHRTLAESEAEGEPEFDARIGIHLGETIIRRNPPRAVHGGASPLEIEGVAEPIAERLMNLAGPRQTLLTRGAFDLARGAISAGTELSEVEWTAHGEYLIEGVDEGVEIFEVGEPGASAAPEGVAGAVRSPSSDALPGWRPAQGLEIPLRPQWRIEQRLGEGGFGEVWLARHVKSGDRRVFKFCWEAERLRSLRREIMVFRLLKEELGERDDIARILDWRLEDDDGEDAPFFIESVYTEGGSLPDWASSRGGLVDIPLAERLEIVAQAATALGAAHSAGVLHKDVKPSNLLITQPRDGAARAVLADFGVGMVTDQERLVAQGITVLGKTELRTETGASGTPIYRAPELLAGRRPSIQSDVYSLGVVLLQVAAGDLHLTPAVGWERRIDDEILREDIAAAVDGNPDRRPRSALEIAEKLRDLGARRSARAEERERIRQIERGARRRRWLTAASAIGIVFSVIVGYLAIQATQARTEAERGRTRAERLIEVMLGDLHGGLEEIGRLDLLETAARGSQEYFDSLPSDASAADASVDRGKTLLNVGDVFLDGGDLIEAQESFESARDLFEAALVAEPDDEALQRGLTLSRLRLGTALRHQGRTDEATTLLEQATEALDAASARRPGDASVRLASAQAGYETCLLRHQIGDLQAATLACTAALKTIEERSEQESESSSRDWRRNALILDLRTTLGGLLRSDRRTDEALAVYGEGEALALRLIEEDSSHAVWPRKLAWIRFQTGFIRYYHLSDLDGAETDLGRARDAYRRFIVQDPLRSRWRARLSLTLHYLGDVRLDRGDPADAMSHYEEATGLLQGLIDADPERLTWMSWAAPLHQAIGRTRWTLDDPDGARAAFRAALDLYAELAQAAEDDPDPWNDVAWARLMLGRAHARAGDEESARREWIRAEEIMTPITAASNSLSYIDTHAQVLLELGRIDAARPMVEALQEAGWGDEEFLELLARSGLQSG